MHSELVILAQNFESSFKINKKMQSEKSVTKVYRSFCEITYQLQY